MAAPPNGRKDPRQQVIAPDDATGSRSGDVSAFHASPDAPSDARAGSLVSNDLLPSHIDLNAIDARSGPDAAPLLSLYGITIADLTDGTRLQIVSPSTLYQGQEVPAGTGNILLQSDPAGRQMPVSYTLRFRHPVNEVRFRRAPLIAARPNGTDHPGWRAIAIGENNQAINEVRQDRLTTYQDLPAEDFVLNGGNFAIQLLHIQGDSGERDPNRAPYLNLLIDDLVVVAPAEALVRPSAAVLRAGFQSDAPSGEDLLAFDRHVQALAAVVAAAETQPPVAVGLFGEWGSGKSFFMRRLRERIELLAAQTNNARAAKAPSHYCGRVVQVEFNAWHYIEHNLWASLATRVLESLFQDLALHGEDAGHDPRLLLAKADVTSATVALGKADADLKQIDARSVRGVATPAPAASAPETGAAAVAENAAAAKTREKLERATNDLAKAVAHKDADQVSVSDLLEVASDLRSTTGSIRRAWIALDGEARAHALRTAVIIAVFIAAGVIAQLLGGVTGLGIVGLSTLLTIVFYGFRLVGVLTHAVDDLFTSERVRALRAERAAAQQRLTGATTELQQAQQLRSQTLPGFVEQRYLSSDYRNKLGIVALIRQDFETLASTMAAAAQAADDRRIERIVLYIDDLDRCPAELVVNVLQAVHLLLAFDLFVVVVGVDSRWLLRSLEQEYTQLAPEAMRSAEPGMWSATPQDYLEKIFQIPFWVPPMETSGYQRLVDDLVRERTAPMGRSSLSDPASVAPPPSAATAATPLVVAGTAGAQIAADLTPANLVIPPDQAEFLKSLAPFLQTPRETKRMVNLYRLLKVSLPDLDAARLSDATRPEFPAVMILLALLAGFPRQGAQVLQALAATGAETWRQFIDQDLKPTQRGGRWLNTAGRALDDEALRAWRRLTHATTLVELPEPLQDIGTMRYWAPFVARYAFWGGPRLVETPAI